MTFSAAGALVGGFAATVVMLMMRLAGLVIPGESISASPRCCSSTTWSSSRTNDRTCSQRPGSRSPCESGSVRSVDRFVVVEVDAAAEGHRAFVLQLDVIGYVAE